MSLDHLNEEEKNILLQLSYFDLPLQGRHKGLTLEEIWIRVKQIPGNGGEVRRERLEEYFSSDRYQNSNLADVTLSGEPYLKVDIQRLAYYAQRLETIKRKTSALNSRIDGLYWEAGLFGIDNVLKADILTSFNGRIDQNIVYLNKVAQLLERTERSLVSKARSIH
jgi:hypothetical protein